MTGRPDDHGKALRDVVGDAWRRFIETCEPIRPELFRYCRYLTHSPWDAEDLVQDAMARAFVTLGCISQALPNPRVWLFRVASNLWIDRTRRRRDVLEPAPELEHGPRAYEDPRAIREVAGTLLA